MPSVRLPLQLGRAALNQGARFAATVWFFPLLLVAAAMLMGVTIIAAMIVGLASFMALGLAVDAAQTAKRDQPSDIVLDETGFVIDGGPLDKTRCTWSEVDAAHSQIIKDDEPRLALRWLLLSWLTGRKIAAITKRVRVPVHHLQLSRKGKGKDKQNLKLAEAEGDELESLEQLRDSLRGAAAPAGNAEPAPLPQEILKCTHCGAPQVPAATPTMICSSCSHELAVPDELQQRMRASIELDGASTSRAKAVRKLVDQPSARRAGHVIAWCRRLMVLIQPAALIFLFVLEAHQTGHVEHAAGIELHRMSPSDDAVALYDIGLLAFVVAGTFGIAWSVGHAYVANRQALRVLADNFGAVPPIKPGAPSTCRQCGAPLPTSTALLVHCVYCSAENVLGIDPRPAALRHQRERIDLGRGLRGRQRARIRLAIVMPVSALLAFTMVREVRKAWHVPESAPPGLPDVSCISRCGTVTNADLSPRTFVFSQGSARVQATVLPHGALSFSCSECNIELGSNRITPEHGAPVRARIEHGALHLVAR